MFELLKSTVKLIAVPDVVPVIPLPPPPGLGFGSGLGSSSLEPQAVIVVPRQ
ncbi:hypothetical protein D3C87_1964080 [compost metagenome]